MKITGTSSYVEIEFNNKVYHFTGEMIVGGFCAYKDTASLVNSTSTELSLSEVELLISEAIKYCENEKFNIEFV